MVAQPGSVRFDGLRRRSLISEKLPPLVTPAVG